MLDVARPVGVPSKAEDHVNGIVPGTIFPNSYVQNTSTSLDSTDPVSFPGPTVNDRQTTVTLFSPSQLAKSSVIPALAKVINDAFESQGHVKDGKTVVPQKRLSYDGQLLDELSSSTGTFTYIICFAGREEVIGTASAKRFLGKDAAVVVEGKEPSPGEAVKNTFTRFGAVADGTEMWELSTMAVDPGLQRQGLAGYLMRITEAEVKRQFIAGNDAGEQRKLVMALTTLKQVNEPFYTRRGFVKDYEVEYPVGHIGSETGFTIIHMSREVDLEESR